MPAATTLAILAILWTVGSLTGKSQENTYTVPRIHLPAEGLLQVGRHGRGASDEHVVSIKTAVCCDNVQMGTKVPKVAEGLDRDHTARGRIGIRNAGFQICGQHFPGPAGKIGQQPPMGHEVDAEALGDAKDPLTVRHMLEHLLAQPLPEL
jgi:hypothetical protein